MKTTELFVEQTLTGFLVLTAAAAPFLSWETLQELPDEAQGGIDIGSAAGAIGVAYLLGVIFDRFADTLLARFNRWNRLLFAVELKKENEALSPEDPFPEDRLQIEVIHQGDEAWEWMDYIRDRPAIITRSSPVSSCGVFLLALGLGLIPLGTGPGRTAMVAVFATGAVLSAISAWAWWRTTLRTTARFPRRGAFRLRLVLFLLL